MRLQNCNQSRMCVARNAEQDTDQCIKSNTFHEKTGSFKIGNAAKIGADLTWRRR